MTFSLANEFSPDSLIDFFFNSPDISIAVLNAEGGIELVNDTFAGLVGKDNNFLKGKDYQQLLPSPGGGRKQFADLVEGKVDKVDSCKVWWADPEAFIYIKGHAKIKFSQKNRTYRIVYFRNISDEVLYLQRLSYQASILSCIEEVVLVVDLMGTVTHWNQGASGFFGIPARDMLNQPIARLKPDFNVLEVLNKNREGDSHKEEWHHDQQDGSIAYLEVEYSTFKQGGEVEGLIMVGTDITEKKEKIKLLYRKQKELNSLINSQTNFLIRTDLEGKFTFVNPSFKKRYDDYGELLGMHSLETILPEDHQKTRELVEVCLKEPGKMMPIEIRKPTKDGTPCYNYWEFVAITDITGQPTEIQGVGYEITDKKKSEYKIMEQNQQLDKVNTELDYFVYSTSHNLRAPLTSILGIVDLMKGGDLQEDLKQYVQWIEKSVKHLDETIQEINDFSKNARFDINVEPINLQALIYNNFERLSYMDNANKVDLKLDISLKKPLNSDHFRLNAIFNNLLSNVIKYQNKNKDNSFVHIWVTENQQGVKILIADNGIGIKEEHLDKVTDMFFRASNQANGSGLGMYIVKEAVSKLHGHISIDSTFQKGTSIEIYLPYLAI